MILKRRSLPWAETAVTKILKKRFKKNELSLMHSIFEMFVQMLKGKEYVLMMDNDNIFLKIYVTSEIIIDSCLITAKDISVTDIHLITESIFAKDGIEDIANRNC